VGAKLEGSVAVVSGAGSIGAGFGIGKAIAVLLARDGAKVVLVDISEERANDTLEVIEREGGAGTVVVADLEETGAPGRIVDAAVRAYGGVDIVVNNAAHTGGVGLLDTSDELLQRMFAINVAAPFMLCKAAIPSMIERGGGSIVNITSIMAIRGQGGSAAAYATTKAALMGLTVDLADAYGRDGIRVNTVVPGMVGTPLLAGLIAEKGLDSKALDLADRTALGVMGEAWDIARAVAFLAGPDAKYITNVTLPVDGGASMRTR
jgi:NAD(P)-dependent dehydrogenase (short-subunit alcohol dehydrogenase family)